MSYRQRRRLYSQNFLRNPKLVNQLVRNSSVGKSDAVLEIGAGSGNITQELVNTAGRVVAYEVDEKLILYLKKRFSLAKNLELFNSDFLSAQPLNYPYKVFANIPFNITADIIRKLTNDSNFVEGYLVVQKEAAKKFIGKPYGDKNSMMAALLKPWFEISVHHKFLRHDFIPFPHVDSVMIKIKRLREPLIPYFEKDNFRDFVLYSYNRDNIGRESFEYVLNRFEVYINTASEREKQYTRMQAVNILKAQKNIQKIHRTRNNKNWRNF